MVVDSSALVALLLGEPESQRIAAALEQADLVVISAASLVEVFLVMVGRTGQDARGSIDALLRELDATVAPVTEAHWRAAAEAFLRYGKGRHPAGLNFGDCLTYATARLAGLPLLYKGDDFRATDLASAG
jgi:ribonuclease VapC